MNLGASLFLLADLLLGAFFENGPDPAIFPKQKIPLHFDHSYHVRKPDEAKGLQGEGLECTFCHENVSASKLSSDRDIPGHESCESCHDEIEDQTKCSYCHKDLLSPDPARTTTVAQPLDIPVPNVKFPHELHVKAKVACTDCHKNVPAKTLATRDDFPTMDRCIECHQERNVSTQCQTCHLTDKDGRVQKHYASGNLEPARYHSFAVHDAKFLEDHAVPAQRDKQYCDQCHAERECLACHDGVGRDERYHPGDWIAVHYLEARKDELRCQSCHRLQTFCFNCHVQSGIATVNPTESGFINTATRRTIRRNGAIPTGPHPMGEAWRGDGTEPRNSRNFHGFHAQRNIRACVACHQEQFCIQCHGSIMTGAARGFSPHGPNPERFKGNSASKHVARACLKCHTPDDPSWRE
jgi:hypothetical protein